MRSQFVLLLLFIAATAFAQNKPEIVGQKEISTDQGTPVSIQLSDLIVEEHEPNEGGSDTPGNGDQPGSEDPEDDSDDDSGEAGEEDDDEDEDNDDHNGGDKDHKKNKDRDHKDNKDHKNDKNNKKHKGKGHNGGRLTYPDGYTLEVFGGKNYTFSGATILPDASFTGVLSVSVRVRNAKYASPKYDVKITVRQVNKQNTAPTITDQVPLTVSANQSVEILLSHLLVQDPDNRYPNDFTLKVYNGEHYSLSKNTVTPARDFVGELGVNVSVNDGTTESSVFRLLITVTPGANKKPVITGQAGIKIPEGQQLTIELSHLAVQDSDNRYPEDFTLKVSAGESYRLNGNTITPDEGFRGTLSIPVTVNDGKNTSDPYALLVQVVAKDRLEIVGQQPIEIPEDSSVVITAGQLIVNDPANHYPQGFSVVVQQGNNYKVVNNTVRPLKDFWGNLTVNVTVRSGEIASAPFSMLIVVQPVNDAPEIMNVEDKPIAINGAGPWPLFDGVELVDADDHHLVFAEIAFDDSSYNAAVDRLQFEPEDSLRTVFDEKNGVLFALGLASLSTYQKLVRSVTYTYASSTDTVRSTRPKRIHITINDGKQTSMDYTRMLVFENDIPLEIPSAFTPNNDNANDTWKIVPITNAEQLTTIVRVYDRRGNTVFESNDLGNEWDGYFHGSPLPADVYFYTIELDLAYKKVNYKGVVAILR